VRKDLSLSLEGEGRSVKAGGITISVTEFSQSLAGVKVYLKAEGLPWNQLRTQLSDPVLLVDDAGKVLKGICGSSGGGGKDCVTWEYWFPNDLPHPKKIVVPWASDIQKVEIPFKFEGVKLP